jgi:hypothetical protein
VDNSVSEQEIGVDEIITHETTTITIIIAIVLFVLLAAAGIYCMLQGKVTNDLAALFYAGGAMIGVAVVGVLIAGIWFYKHPPPEDSCFNACWRTTEAAKTV